MPGLIKTRPMPDALSIQPAPFVVGVPRSGTTLLRLQLDAHPELAIPSETGFGFVAARFGGASPTRQELLAALTALPEWADLGVEREQLAESFEELPRWSVGDGLRAYYRTYAASQGKARYGDKTPGHANCMDVLASALPEARFIHIIRDGRDVAASLRGLPFAPGDGGIEAIAATWRDTIWRATRLGSQLPHYMEVRYEQLVSDPEAVLREVCEFVDLHFDPAMLRAHERASERLAELQSAQVGPDGVVHFADGTKIITRTRQPPDSRRAGRWREALSEYDVRRFERFAGGALADRGYTPYEHLSTLNAVAVARPGRTSRMRVVLGRFALDTPGGTETYAVTVARELERLGHDVTLAAEALGVMADVARQAGLRVTHLDQLPSECDAVLAHDLPMAATLAERYPGARLVYVAHSDGFDAQLPPLIHGVVDAVIACSDRFAARVRALPLDVPIVRLREPIDTDGSLYPPPLPPRPRRALIVSNYLRGERRRLLVEAWEAAGVECVQLGMQSEVVADPRPAMRAADIVVAKARAALEAMSCGRAVYLYDQFGGDGWITPDSYPSFEADHFAGQGTPGPRSRADLVADLGVYNPDMGIANSELIRTHHGARHHAIEVAAVLRGEHRLDPDRADAVAELARLARASQRAESQAFTFVQRAESAEAEAAAWQGRAAEAERQLEEARFLLGTRRVRAGLALGRAADRLRPRA